ncbi:MAG: energy transducer TonB [Gammaproteobacteria bacterium]
MTGYRVGFLGSLVLHAGLVGAWWVLVDPQPPGGEPLDRALPLTLAMFQQLPPAAHEPNSTSASGELPEATPPRAAEPSASAPQHAQARTVPEPAKPVPTESPTLTPVPEDRAAKPLLPRQPPPVVASSPTRMAEVKAQPLPPQRASAPRRLAKASAPAIPRPAGAAAISGSRATAIDTAARRSTDGARAAELEEVYLEQLWQALERSKFYPRQARRRGLQGLVQVRFRVLRDGSFEDLQVIAGSGSSLLDRAALQTVTQASGAVPFPSELPKPALVVSLPITYRWQ